MQKKKVSTAQTKPSGGKNTQAKTTKKVRPTVPSQVDSSHSQIKLQRGKANLQRLLRKIEDVEHPYAGKNAFRSTQVATEDCREEYTTNNISSAYTISLENINTKEQTFATNEENRHEYELKSIWAEQFEEFAARKIKEHGLKDAAKKHEIDKNRPKHNKSCNDRFVPRKAIIQSAFNSLDSCKGGKSPKMVRPKTGKLTKKTKKPITSTKTSNANSVLTTPRSNRSYTEQFRCGTPIMYQPQKSPKRKIQIPPPAEMPQIIHPESTNNRIKKEPRKITEVSDQQLQCSIVKSSTLKNASFKKNALAVNQVPHKKTKAEVMKALRQQIRHKVNSLYPTLQQNEKKLICAVILVQRLWRQSKVKNIIGKFLTPKKFNETPNFPYKPEPKLQKSSEKKTPRATQQERSTLEIIAQKVSESIDLPGDSRLPTLSSTSTVPPEKQQKNILKFVDSYRNMILDAGKLSQKKQQKQNFFNLTSSLSQKCLMEKFYKKIFHFQTEQDVVHDKLTIRKAKVKKQQEKEVKNPEPAAQMCTVLSSQRFYTEAKEDEPAPKTIQATPKIDQRVERRQAISNSIVDTLINEFLEQFVRQSKKSQAKLKNKKKKLPGIKISKTTIGSYLDGLIQYLFGNHQQEIITNLNKIIGIDPRTLLKFLRDDFDQSGFEQDEDEYCKGPVINKDVFFHYQQIFERDCFQIDKDDKRYTNFIEGIVKIHNKSLLDCFTQCLDLVRIYGLRGRPHPWQKQPVATVQTITESNIMTKLNQAKKIVQKVSEYNLGCLDKRMPHYQAIEQQNLLFVLRQDYSRDQYEWEECTQEKLEIELALSQWLTDHLIDQFFMEIPHAPTFMN